MKSFKSHVAFSELSLVPLADMLTNTVGIILFILIFTVLTAGGVVVAKRLPIERSTKAEPLDFLCADGRLLPVDQTLVDKFLEPLGKATSYYTANAWITNYNARRVEDECFVVQGDGKIQYYDSGFQRFAQFDLLLSYIPKPGKGETILELKQATSRFRKILREHQKENRFIHLFVRPDAIDVFQAARSVAVEEMTPSAGWMPLNSNAPVRFTLSRGGIPSRPQ